MIHHYSLLCLMMEGYVLASFIALWNFALHVLNIHEILLWSDCLGISQALLAEKMNLARLSILNRKA